MQYPPTKKSRRAKQWAERKKFQLKHLVQYFVAAIFNLVSRFLKLHPETVTLIRRSFELGNPTQTVWPSETIPMVSRLLAGGFWNFSFFQFNRGFYFPFWAQRQYDPKAPSFIPRSHNVLSLNQTQRNWMSTSFPGKPTEVSIDRAAALMPSTDSYTLEFAILDKKGKVIRPHDEIEQVKISLPGPSQLEVKWRGRRVEILATQEGVKIKTRGSGNIIISVRPFNYEGPFLLDKLNFSEKKNELRGDVKLAFNKASSAYVLSNLHQGDALKRLPKMVKQVEFSKEYSVRKKRRKYVRDSVKDHMGLATASFLFAQVEGLEISIDDQTNYQPPTQLVAHLGRQDSYHKPDEIWNHWFANITEMKIPAPYDKMFFYMKNHLLTLWDFDSITPGSFTYHHFWIRDAAIMMYALLKLGGRSAVRTILDTFDTLIKRNGLFHSQAGEWDANGQALWIIGEYVRLTGDVQFLDNFQPKIKKMVNWLDKEVHKNRGVLPPGFSAEHLGVADWYLWDNFWTLGGLNSLAKVTKTDTQKVKLINLYEHVHYNLDQYLDGYKYFPAALGRKKDAGMIGSVSAIYPLNLDDYYNKRMLNTLQVIRDDHFFQGGFFQENIHSGINPYLSMQVAESFLHMGLSADAFEILEKIHGWANFGYTYPEAVHPQTRGGCMGDGFHGWAFAELLVFLTNLFFLEKAEKPIFLAGVPASWLKQDFSVTNLRTPLGNLNIELNKRTLSISGLVTHAQHVYLALPLKWNKPKAIQGLNTIVEELPWHEKKGLNKSADRKLYKLTLVESHIKVHI